MKGFFISIILLLLSTVTFGQDGSDIKYVPIAKLDKSFVGKFAQLDFGKKSFRSYFSKYEGDSLASDTTIINVDNTPIRFMEHRVDDGFNNWFSQQYLVSLDAFKGQIIRITQCTIDSVTKDSILVTNYLKFYDLRNQPLPDKSQQLEYWFGKKDIAEVLIYERSN